MRGSWLIFCLFLGTGCRDQVTTPNDDAGNVGNDATTGPSTCRTTADCKGTGVCNGGICEAVTTCTTDQPCSISGQVCHSTRGYCVECDGRHAGECPENQTCRFDFTCVPFGMTSTTTADGGVPGTDAAPNDPCSGACTEADRTSCAASEVCKNDRCCPPPARCISDVDCPTARPVCNGQNGACFGGESCLADQDCLSKPGCGSGGCFCDMTRGDCRVRPNECDKDSDCDAPKYCTLDGTPRRCLDAPACASDDQCLAAGLVCEQGLGLCKNGLPCPNGTECSATQACVGGICVGKTCLNTPSLCTASQTCDGITAKCVENPTSQCTKDLDCPTSYYCDLAVNDCASGCRDDTECPGGICNSVHACSFPSGNLCGPCTTDADCPGGTTCKSALTGGKVCYEGCSVFRNELCMINPAAECVFINCACFIPSP